MNKISTLTISRLGESASYLAAIVECSDDAIVSKNMDGVITSWNVAAERIFGYTAEEAVGSPISLIIPPDRLSEEAEIMARLKNGQRIDHIETVRVTKDGRFINLSITISPIQNSEGKIIGASKVARDITERKEMEAKLREYNAHVERTKKEMEDITHIVSHDLKEPLRGLMQQAMFLKEDFADKLGPHGLKQIERLIYLSERSMKLVNEILEFSRLGKFEFAMQDIDPNAIVKEIEQMMKNILDERNARIMVPHPMPKFSGDKTVITEVMRNLITNAVVYNDKEHPVVEIGFLKEMDAPHGRERNVFYIKDNGVGIPPKFQNSIFGLFKRLPTSRKYNSNGTGVGLTFVKKLIERCDGRVWLESEPGKGSTFYFTAGRCAFDDDLSKKNKKNQDITWSG